jgi:hypothetical protein
MADLLEILGSSQHRRRERSKKDDIKCVHESTVRTRTSFYEKENEWKQRRETET